MLTGLVHANLLWSSASIAFPAGGAQGWGQAGDPVTRPSPTPLVSAVNPFGDANGDLPEEEGESANDTANAEHMKIATVGPQAHTDTVVGHLYGRATYTNM